MDFYNDPSPWTPPKDCWPTNDDIMHYYISHIKNGTRDKHAVTSELAQFVKDVWEKGNGCPLTKKAILPRFDKLFAIYQKYRKGEGRGSKQGGHRKKKTNDPPPQPSRKSARLAAACAISTEPASSNLDECPIESEPVPKKPVCGTRSSKRVPSANPFKEEWMEDYGCELFDVKSKVCLLAS